MALIEMVMPKMGESIMEGTILNWLKNVGDHIAQDESVLEVATDKVDTEVPATHAGILKEILAQKGEVIPVGKAIAIISTGDEVSPQVVVPQKLDLAKETVVREEKSELLKPVASSNGVHKLNKPESNRFYS